jgi:hypothetical protein
MFVGLFSTGSRAFALVKNLFQRRRRRILDANHT